MKTTLAVVALLLAACGGQPCYSAKCGANLEPTGPGNADPTPDAGGSQTDAGTDAGQDAGPPAWGCGQVNSTDGSPPSFYCVLVNSTACPATTGFDEGLCVAGPETGEVCGSFPTWNDNPNGYGGCPTSQWFFNVSCDPNQDAAAQCGNLISDAG